MRTQRRHPNQSNPAEELRLYLPSSPDATSFGLPSPSAWQSAAAFGRSVHTPKTWPTTNPPHPTVCTQTTRSTALRLPHAPHGPGSLIPGAHLPPRPDGHCPRLNRDITETFASFLRSPDPTPERPPTLASLFPIGTALYANRQLTNTPGPSPAARAADGAVHAAATAAHDASARWTPSPVCIAPHCHGPATHSESV